MAPSQKSSPIFAVVIGLLLLAAVLGSAVGVYNYQRGPVVQTLRLAQLAPLPRAAHDVSSQSTPAADGFTVTVRFHAPLAEIDAWIQRSPSARTLTPERRDAHTRHYALQPMKAARRADLTVDETGEAVEIELEHT